ncbi:amino acid adenylation domain-containing protein [Nannocystis poenicansa]|uniref:Amino acid adenylation domain-containing protein n=1 Tax=Nannocystis punicea TaxID=2995304 RepID=A0ABY7HKJ6_9BACT|nr:non-ribosomal peptide synthetase/type I polyketide synthase [Nannocystis poenicansa]WAS99550.1 amino acid adenylation domain-containing protein [Nannocystis poenicansa]
MDDSICAPLSTEQARMWVLARFHGALPAFHERGAVWLDGEVDAAQIRRALGSIVARHEALRTTITEVCGQPAQIVRPPTEPALRVVHLDSDGHKASDGDALAVAAEEACIPFDLEQGPLFRVTLLRLHERRHLLVLVMHHIASDGDASIELFFAELFAAYHGDRPSPLPLQYQDYARSQVDHDPEVLARQLAYWRAELSDAPVSIALPVDRPRSAAQTFAGAHEERRLEPGLTAALRVFAGELGVDLYSLLLAALESVLHRHSHQDDILVGAPLAGRAHPDLRGIIGYFGNPVVFRGRFAGDPSFREFAQGLHRAVQGARENGEVSFQAVVETLAPPRDPSRTPLFQVLFHLRPPPRAPRQGSSFVMTPVDVDLPHVAYDLIVTVQEVAGGLTTRAEYNRDLFDPATVARLLGHWEVLLRGAAQDPDARVSRLPLMTADERRSVLAGLDMSVPSRGADRLHVRFEAHARRAPDAPALCFDATMTYGELDRRSNQVAHLLRKFAVGPDVLVGVCMDRSCDMLVAMLGILKAGGAYVPFDPAHPAQRLEFMLADSEVAVLLSKDRYTTWVPADRTKVVRFDAERALLDAEPVHAVEPLAGEGPENLAYVMYTSGSTGKPKGAGVQHRCVLNLVVDTDYMQVEPDDHVAQTANASFDAATMEIWGALMHGAELVGITRDVALSPETLARKIAAHPITVMVLTPALFAQVARELPGAFAPLKTLVCGGDALEPEAVRMVLEAGPPQNLVNGYGPTETTTCATWFRVEQPPPPGASIPIGRPVARATAYILDRHQQPAPIGVSGEIWIGGEGVGRGYFRRPALTAERFLCDPFAARPGATMYRTGDLGRVREDGTIEFLGRIDHQLKIRGFRIELGEIEAAIAEQAGVRQAAVIAPVIGGERQVLAYVATNRGDNLRGTDDAFVRGLRRALALRLPDYMIPAAFYLLEALPLTPNGKLDRKALPAPDESRPSTGREHVAPRSELEELLAGVWKELLALPRVGVHDNFFELGGHSLHAVQLFSRLRAVLSVEVRFQEFFNAATVAELAALVRRERRAPGTEQAIAGAPRGEPLPLSFGQERLWFLKRLAPGSRAYNCMYPYRFTGALNVPALDRSLRALVERHEILRTTYAEIEGRPVQIVHERGAYRLDVVDLRHLPAEAREAEVRERLEAEGQQLFDLERGPLFRAGLLRLAEDQHVLWLHFHHLTMDGWSTELAFREISALYANFCEDAAPPLAELPLQYADFAVWQRTHLSEESTAALLRYWKGALRGAPLVLDLPGDRPRPPVQSFDGAAVHFALSAAHTQALRALSVRHGTTLTMVLLAAFAVLLHRYTRAEDLLIGMPSANRDRVELEGIMGFFVNTLPMRVDLSGDPTFFELLSRVRRTCLEAYDHDALPFERLVHELRLARDVSRNPLVQVAYAPQPPAGRDLQLPGLYREHWVIDAKKSIFDLSFYSWESAGGVACIFEYSADRFERATIERMIAHLQRLVAAVAAEPERPLSALSMLADAEQQTLRKWSRGRDGERPSSTVLDRFEQQARSAADALAVVSDRGSLTYGALDRRANQLAHLLRGLGVGAGALVGVCAGRSLELVVALVAVLKASAAYVPFDPEGSAERLAGMLASAGTTVLIAGPGAAEELPGYAGHVVRLDDAGSVLSTWSETCPPRRADLDALAYVIYTSGSTGRPKGVLVEHRGLANLVAWHERRFAVTSADRATLVASPGFDASVWELWPYLAVGASLFVPEASLRLSPAEMRDWLVQREITVSFQPTAIAEELLRLEWPARCALRFLLTGGDRLRVRPGLALPFAVVNNYGPTEASVVTTSCPVEPDRDVTREPAIGGPIDGMVVHVLDARGQRAPAGVPGELFIGGLGLARGYLGHPGLTAEKFVPDPFSDEPGARLYRSGDLVRWLPDGHLEFLGRIDEQVKIRGFRIEPGEIAAALREHPAVHDAVVLALADEHDAKRLVAYFTRADVGDASSNNSLASQQGEHVSSWRALYEETYEARQPDGDPRFNIVGWNSSYTGAPIEAEAMRAWRDRTVERILSFSPRRAWEIGCGTGLLLLQVAPSCATYLGTDFSEHALAAIRPQLADGLAHVNLQRREAADFAAIEPGSLDTIILNSIAQYFPGEDYLRSVLTGAVRSVADAGVVFVGDVRSLPLLAAFHTSVQLAKAAPDTPLAELRERVQRAVLREEELTVSPEYFHALGEELPRIAHVEVWLKRGRGTDEMTRYRYDAVLHVGEAPAPVEAGRTLAWADVQNLEALAHELRGARGATIELLGVPNERVLADVRASEALRQPGWAEVTSAELIARSVATAIEPEALWELGEQLGHAVRVTWSRERGPGFMDALFEPARDVKRPRAWARARHVARRAAASLVNNPLRERQAFALVARLREHLAAKLPDYMVPAAFVELEALPRNASGKLDRHALPAPERTRPTQATEQAVADVEAVLIDIWRGLLHIGEIGLDEPFFELGGHSLLLAQVRAAISTRLGPSMPIVELFQYPTIRSLANRVRELTGKETSGRAPISSAHVAARKPIDAGVPEDAIAIVGLAGRFPRAPDIDTFWHNLRDGVEGLTFYTTEEMQALGVASEWLGVRGLVPASGALEDALAFDAAFFGYNPNDAALMDPQQRVFLEVAWAALEHAGHDPFAYPGSIGVFAGSDAPNYWMERIGFRGGPLASEQYRTSSANMTDGLTTRVAYKLGLRGPAVTLLTACSTSLVAVHFACKSLLARECDMALAGGVAIHPQSRVGHVYEDGSLVSPDGHCRPFDADARGTVNGNGVGAVVLKRLADALADGDTIHAVVRGSAVANDGARKVGYTAPGLAGQIETIARAHAAAAVDPESITYVEAHGTGTRLGDPIEVAALTEVFRRSTQKIGFCALGSVKGNIGHLGAASGVTGLIKAVLSLEHELIPPTLHFRRPNPELSLETSPFFVRAEPVPWPRGATPRRAGVSAFGVGGTNAHVVLEEAPAIASPAPADGSQLLVLSARTEVALEASTDRLAAHLRGAPAVDLGDVASTLQRGRARFSHRRAVVATNLDEAAARLAARDPLHGATGIATSEPPPVVFMFPGGGTQELDMGRELYLREPVYRASLDRCAELFAAAMAIDLRALLFPEADARARATEQVLRPRENFATIFSTEYALAELLLSWGIRPAAVTGHSLGEYAAACVAGVLTLADAVALLVARGELYEALPEDVLTLIVRLPEDALARRLDDEVSLAAVNGPDNCVVSGPGPALRRLEAELLREGCDVKRLAIATAAHSSLVEPFAARLTERAATLTRKPPRVPMISNLTGRFVTEADATDPSYWARHLRGTVRFAAGLATLLDDPRHVFLEVGPGSALTKLVTRHPKGGPDRIAVSALASPVGERRDAEALLRAVGRLWCAGVDVDWDNLSGERRRRVPLPTYPFERTRHVYAGARAEAPLPADGDRIAVDLAAESTEIAAKFARLRDAGGPESLINPEMLAGLDRVSAAHFFACLFAGKALDVGATCSRRELLAELGILPKFEKYFDFFLHSLVEEGALQIAGDTIELLPGAHALSSPRALTASLAERFPEARGVLGVLEHCGASYRAALRGDVDNTSVLHPDGTYDLLKPAEELLVRASRPEVPIRMVRDIVNRALRSAGGRTVRILEFGGGRGVLTWKLAPFLEGHSVEYLFTDISRYFTLNAEERARQEGLEFMRWGRLDIDEDPAEQGHQPGSFDIIVSLDAFHVARDLEKSLAALRRLLAPGGLMVLVEMTEVARWHTAVWGLEEGWWHFEDTHLRRYSPSLSAAGWEQLFAAQGFRSAHVFPRTEAERAGTDHVVISTQEHPTRRASSRAAIAAATTQAPPAGRSRPPRAVTPPRTDTERTIAALWERALGLDQVGVDDDFFALGGDSLIAVGMLTKLRATFEVALDSHALVAMPTIARLSAGIEERQRGVTGPSDFDELIRLQDGDPERPLFLVHPVGGHVYCYSELVRSLRLDRAIYAIRSPGLADRRARPVSIEALARDYLHMVRAVQPEGPYVLGGWSFGGAVAFEMASQLRVAGQDVLPLLLVDSPSPTLFGRGAADIELRAFQVFAAEMGLTLATEVTDSSELADLRPSERLAYLFDRLQRERLAPEIAEVGQLEHLLQVLTDNMRAWYQYEPRPYSGTVLQFRAREPMPLLVADAAASANTHRLSGALGWEEHTSGSVEAREIPGNHFTIMKDANVERLAAAMRGYLQREAPRPAPDLQA